MSAEIGTISELREFNIVSPFQSTGNIVVHFAAATPMESPASNIDEPISPLDPTKSISTAFEQHLNAHANSVFQNGAPPHLHGNTSHLGNLKTQALVTTNVLTISTGEYV